MCVLGRWEERGVRGVCREVERGVRVSDSF